MWPNQNVSILIRLCIRCKRLFRVQNNGKSGSKGVCWVKARYWTTSGVCGMEQPFTCKSLVSVFFQVGSD